MKENKQIFTIHKDNKVLELNKNFQQNKEDGDKLFR